MEFAVFDTAAGFCGIAWGEAGIGRFLLPEQSEAAAWRSAARRLPQAVPAALAPEAAAAVAMAQAYFSGARVDFSGVRVDLGRQEEFFARVYALVRRLGWGETTTYGAVARALGAGPEAARDVGQAMARNPVPLIVPCHRVLAAGGRVGGFSAPGGAEAKRRMLALEGVAVEPAERQASFAF